MASGAKGRDNRDERERTRAYQARVAMHEAQVKRRYRDNLVGGIVGGIILLVVIGAQTAYFVSGPGAPTPNPSVAPSSTLSPSPTATSLLPVPTATP